MNIGDRIVVHGIDKKYIHLGKNKFQDFYKPFEIIEMNPTSFDIIWKHVDYSTEEEIVRCMNMCFFIDKDPRFISTVCNVIGEDNDFYDIAMDWWQNTILGSPVSLWALTKMFFKNNHEIRQVCAVMKVPNQ